MSGFTPTVPFETEFEGDVVTMRLKRLTRGQMRPLTKFVMMEAQEDFVPDMDYVHDLIEAFEAISQDVVLNFKGVTDKEGNPVELETVMKEEYFTKLATRIAGEVMSISLITEDVQKKLDKLREGDSQPEESKDLSTSMDTTSIGGTPQS